MKNKTTKKRIFYFDLLKFFAIFAIIALHVFQIWMNGEQILNFDIYSLAELTRFGVPIFLMVSGALLLNKEIDIKIFFKKRLSRIIYPFIFFFILTIIFIDFIFNLGFSWNFFEYSWYFWMILGVYLSIPIINKFIQNCSMGELEYFIIIFIVASIFYQFTLFFKFTHFLDLNFFVAPLGYVLLGYYLSKKDFDSNYSNSKHIVILSICLFVISTVLKVIGALQIVPLELTANYSATTSPILSSWLDVGFLEIVQASSVFLFCRYFCKLDWSKLTFKFNSVRKIIISISSASYGIYLINVIFMCVVRYIIVDLKLTGSEICMNIFIISIVILFGSWLVILIINKIPYMEKISGYH